MIEDVTFRYNVIRHAGNGIYISGLRRQLSDLQGQRIASRTTSCTTSTARRGAATDLLQMGNQPRDIVVDHNTVQHTGNVVTVYGKRDGGPAVVDGLSSATT